MAEAPHCRAQCTVIVMSGLLKIRHDAVKDRDVHLCGDDEGTPVACDGSTTLCIRRFRLFHWRNSEAKTAIYLSASSSATAEEYRRSIMKNQLMLERSGRSRRPLISSPL